VFTARSPLTPPMATLEQRLGMLYGASDAASWHTGYKNVMFADMHLCEARSGPLSQGGVPCHGYWVFMESLSSIGAVQN